MQIHGLLALTGRDAKDGEMRCTSRAQHEKKSFKVFVPEIHDMGSGCSKAAAPEFVNCKQNETFFGQLEAGRTRLLEMLLQLLYHLKPRLCPMLQFHDED